MRKLALLGLLLLATASIEFALAMNPSKKDGLYVTTNVVYKNHSLNIKLRKAAIFQTLSTWGPLTDAIDGIVILGRVTERTENSARFELILMDSSKSSPFVISNIQLDAEFGEKSTTTVIAQDGAHATISVRAHPTKFTELFAVASH